MLPGSSKWALLTNVTTNSLHYSLIGSNGSNHLRLFAYYCYNCSCSSQAIVVPLTGGSCKDPFRLHTLFSLPVWWTVFQDTLRTLGWLRCPWCPPRLETSIDLLFSDVSQPHNALVGTDAVQFQCCSVKRPKRDFNNSVFGVWSLHCWLNAFIRSLKFERVYIFYSRCFLPFLTLVWSGLIATTYVLIMMPTPRRSYCWLLW